MLKINDQIRKLLKATGAIQFDADGEEVLAGLTPAESVFVLECSQEAPSVRNPGDAFLLNQLKHRHLNARLSQLGYTSNSIGQPPLPLPPGRE